MVSIENEKRAIDTVAEQTGLMKHKILHQRKIMGGVNAAKENEHMVQKQVRTSFGKCGLVWAFHLSYFRVYRKRTGGVRERGSSHFVVSTNPNRCKETSNAVPG